MEEIPITRQNLFSLNVPVGKETFQAVSILALFSPAIIFFGLHLLENLRRRHVLAQNLSFLTTLWYLLMGAFAIVYLIVCIKRWRDTGKPWWLVLIPVYNLYILLFSPSKNLER
jgi:uncharacterized membrane protein YhaH (DUF805 family)